MEQTIAQSKSQRLTRLSHLLYRHPHGLTTRELASLCDVDQRTVQRDLVDLEEMGIPLWDDEGTPRRYGVISGYYIPPIHLSLPEAASLYLAGRLLARNYNRNDAHAVAALAKLAHVLPASLAAQLHASVQRMAAREKDREYERVFETLVTAWATQRVVLVRYRRAGSDNARELELWPYFLEASGVGGSVYVIGYALHANAMRTLKVDRIVAATLTDRTFAAPDDLNGPRLLDSCWGVMYGDEREQVVLRFDATASRRVHETHWHPSQQLTALPDGGCELRLEIANPQEMLYWIRGWGPQVEVLAPEWLRAEVAADAEAAAGRYRGTVS